MDEDLQLRYFTREAPAQWPFPSVDLFTLNSRDTADDSTSSDSDTDSVDSTHEGHSEQPKKTREWSRKLLAVRHSIADSIALAQGHKIKITTTTATTTAAGSTNSVKSEQKMNSNSDAADRGMCEASILAKIEELKAEKHRYFNMFKQQLLSKNTSSPPRRNNSADDSKSTTADTPPTTSTAIDVPETIKEVQVRPSSKSPMSVNASVSPILSVTSRSASISHLQNSVAIPPRIYTSSHKVAVGASSAPLLETEIRRSSSSSSSVAFTSNDKQPSDYARQQQPESALFAQVSSFGNSETWGRRDFNRDEYSRKREPASANVYRSSTNLGEDEFGRAPRYNNADSVDEGRYSDTRSAQGPERDDDYRASRRPADYTPRDNYHRRDSSSSSWQYNQQNDGDDMSGSGRKYPRYSPYLPARSHSITDLPNAQFRDNRGPPRRYSNPRSADTNDVQPLPPPASGSSSSRPYNNSGMYRGSRQRPHFNNFNRGRRE